MIRDEFMCSVHGYAHRPNDPTLYKVINPPEPEEETLCQECTDVIIKRGIKYPGMKENKVWFNIMKDSTKLDLKVGKYAYLRLVVKKQS